MRQIELPTAVGRVRTLLVPAALLVGLLLVAGTSLLAASTHQPFGTYSRDTLAVAADAGASLPPLAGGLAMVNMMVWASTASMSALAAMLWPPQRRWLLGFALLNALLALDDALLLHDGVGPALGVPEACFSFVYAAIGVLLLFDALRSASVRADDGTRRFHVRKVSAGGRAFTVGLVLLGISVVVDAALHGPLLWEDGAKLLGAMVWLTVPVLELPSNWLSGPSVDRRHT